MKKILCLMLLALEFSFGYAMDLEVTAPLTGKMILQNNEGYFILGDGTFWKAVPFVKRWRTLGEWWNNVELAPKNYDCTPNDWYLGSSIAIYPKNKYLELSLSDASNEETLKQCTHLLVHSNTEQTLFAIALNPSECMSQLFTQARKEGYDDGYLKGINKRSSSYQDVYDSAYTDGYKKGYEEGLRIGLGR